MQGEIVEKPSVIPDVMFAGQLSIDRNTQPQRSGWFSVEILIKVLAHQLQLGSYNRKSVWNQELP